MAQGKTTGTISQLLDTFEKTVKKHLGNIFVKLGVENRGCATLRALERLAAQGG